jgi:hypothetical protein
MDLNGLSIKTYLNIIPLGSYDWLIGIYWLDKNHSILDCYTRNSLVLMRKKT